MASRLGRVRGGCVKVGGKGSNSMAWRTAFSHLREPVIRTRLESEPVGAYKLTSPPTILVECLLHILLQGPAPQPFIAFIGFFSLPLSKAIFAPFSSSLRLATSNDFAKLQTWIKAS